MRYAKKMNLPIFETRVCLRCGKEFGVTVRQKNKLYCDDCKEIHKIERRKTPEYIEHQKQYLKKYRMENRYIPKRHITKCKRCGNEFISGSGKTYVCIACLEKSENPRDRRLADYRRNYSKESEQIRLSNQYHTSEN